MKYVFYLLVMSIIFSIGLYLGVDRTSPDISQQGVPVITAEEPKTDGKMNNELIVDRQAIIDEIKQEPKEILPEDQPFLSHVASGGEQIVQTVCDSLVSITHTFVNELF
ncbi:hypothetical protein F9U64_17490 [Gracilibacillus oryzae]|uniref:DUF3679 domain-containing protein n=1 Tax=Gracilibacillus oryzae TaxID=1672701 RepID=A0A7C8KT24_9BACI|nr:hypothetical protein [Gracilibacillus oryzae]KAB8127561.1 hypothetical protein F9U64_17490 [Gracilibacillus oryzae]